MERIEDMEQNYSFKPNTSGSVLHVNRLSDQTKIKEISDWIKNI